jgi:hypothetical protein
MSASPPPASRLPVWLLLIAAALGVPTAAGWAFAQQVTQYPWLALGLTLLYELLVAIGWFIAQIGQRLGTRWADAAADLIDTRVQGFFPKHRYQKRYFQHLIYQHRWFDIKGLTTQGPYDLELEQVFVELRVAAQAPHQLSPNPIPIPEAFRDKSFTIEAYSQSQAGVAQNLAIVGPPGSGKTTLLKNIALTLAKKRKRRLFAHVPWQIPVVLFLRDHAPAIKDNANYAFAQAIHDGLNRQKGPAAPPGWFEHRLENGRCFILLDGLDEVADPGLRKRVGTWVEQQMRAYGANRFIITSRPFGYRSNPLSGVTVLEVRPFSAEQVRRFVHNWYLADKIKSAQRDDHGVRADAKRGAEDLLRRLNNTPALADLSANPLLLTMIATVHRYRSTLPGRRVELYAEICEVFLGRRQQARGIESDLSSAQKQSVLQVLAYKLMCQKLRELDHADSLPIIKNPLARISPWMSGEGFLKLVEDSSGLLLERENAVYSFAHLTFQEYLAAAYIREHNLESELCERVGSSWWHETIRLYAAMGDATAIIQACLRENQPSVVALTLALECREEARQLDPTVRVQLEEVLTRGVEDNDPTRRRFVSETLLSLRLRQFVRLDERRAVDTSLLSNAEYQLFLDEQRAKDMYHQPDHWPGYQFPAGRGRAPMLGVRPSDAVAFCEWLTERTHHEWRYRVPLTDEPLAELADAHANTGYWAGADSHYSCVGVAALDSSFIQRQFTVRVEADLRDAHTYALVLILESANRVAHFLTEDMAGDFYYSTANARNLARDRARDCARDLATISDLARGRANDRDLDDKLAHARDCARDLASDLAHVSDFGHGYSPNLTHARNLAGNLAHALASASKHARNLAHALASASKHAHEVISVGPDDRERDLAFPHLFVNILDRARDFANTHLASAQRDIGSVLDLDQIMSTAHYLASPRHLGAYTRDVRQSDQLRTLIDILSQIRPLPEAIEQALDRAPKGSPDQPTEVEAARCYVRFWMFMFALSLFSEPPHKPSFRERHFPSIQELRARGSTDDELPHRFETACDLYISLAILEERCAGNLSPVEGIRIVQERAEEAAT